MKIQSMVPILYSTGWGSLQFPLVALEGTSTASSTALGDGGPLISSPASGVTIDHQVMEEAKQFIEFLLSIEVMKLFHVIHGNRTMEEDPLKR